MTYRIEIKAETLAELAGKAYAFAVGVQSTIASVNHVSREESASFSVPLSNMTVTHIEPEVAEAAPVDPTPAPKSAPAAEAAESPPTTEQPSTTPAPSASASELNFDTDVAPIVLQVVKEKGKPVAQEIIGQFGVEKASLMDPALWPELVDQLKAAL